VSKKECEELSELEIKGLGLVSTGFLVQHKNFGKGEVEGVFRFSSGENTIRINFEQHGSKSLVPEYANLQPYEQKLTLFGKLKNIFK
jgi:hypothetical protein